MAETAVDSSNCDKVLRPHSRSSDEAATEMAQVNFYGHFQVHDSKI